MLLVFEGPVVVASGFLFGRLRLNLFEFAQLCAASGISSPILVGQSGRAGMTLVLYM
jgi:hypothetical protein